jgi:hypothetical protein
MQFISNVKSRNTTDKTFGSLAFACGYAMLLVINQVSRHFKILFAINLYLPLNSYHCYLGAVSLVLICGYVMLLVTNQISSCLQRILIAANFLVLI